MPIPKKIKTHLTHAGLFLLVFITTTFAGAEWIGGKYVFIPETHFAWSDFVFAISFSGPFLCILTVHEFGHYFTARWHKVRVSLPYFMPLWFGFLPLVGLPPMPSLGTLGAFIRIKDRLTSRLQFFDIGIAGPLAGFVVALGVLYYGFTHLPPPEYIFDIHPEYYQYGLKYDQYVYENDFIDPTYRTISMLEGRPLDNQRSILSLGKNLIFQFFESHVASPELVPNKYELIHYPWLFAGFLALFFTALNLLPIGQLDGGHILYGLIGYNNHRMASSLLFILLVFYAGLGTITPYDSLDELSWQLPFYGVFLVLTFYSMFPTLKNRILLAVSILAVQYLVAYFDPTIQGYQGWLVFAFVIGRFLGVYHPPANYDQPLDTNRQILGWIALAVFIGSFSPQPFIME